MQLFCHTNLVLSGNISHVHFHFNQLLENAALLYRTFSAMVAGEFC